MKKIIALGASSSRNSINRSLAIYTAGQVKDVIVKSLDLNDFEMPIFSVDRERENGIHELAHQFKDEIKNADGIVISFAEHNASYSAAFKNIYDWVSRIAPDVWEGKPMFLAATSPGSRGGESVLELAENLFKRRNTNTIVTFSLPSFNKNFSAEDGITDGSLKLMFQKKLEEFEEALRI